MKILHICASDGVGGAARAAMNIHKSLLEKGIDSRFLTAKKDTAFKNIYGPVNNFAKVRNWSSVLLDTTLAGLFGTKVLPFTSNFFSGLKLKEEHVEWCDLVQLHWIGSGLVRPESLTVLNKPVVWRLSDMYPFTGGCHYSGSCEKYATVCRDCHLLKRSQHYDLTWLNWHRKKRAYDKIDALHIVSPTQWIENKATSSALLKNKNHHLIKTGTDTAKFKRLDKQEAFNTLGLTRLIGKKIIAFGAMHATEDPRKGFVYAKEAMEKLGRASDEHAFLVFGNGVPAEVDTTGLEIVELGHVRSDVELALIYNISDVFLTTSTEENLCNTALEAMACGCPVVAFDVGGMSELITSGENGYLAAIGSSDDIVHGIEVLTSNQARFDYRERARDTIEKKYDLSKNVELYIELYKNILKKRDKKQNAEKTL